MKVIHKFAAPPANMFTIETSPDAKVLCVQNQQGRPCIWMEVDPDVLTVPHTFYIVGTGFEVPDNVDYVGTTQDISGTFVWHYYKARV